MSIFIHSLWGFQRVLRQTFNWFFNFCFKGIYKFTCPAVGEGTKRCNKLWQYEEVRRVANLTVSEMQHFEETMARLAAADFCDMQPVSAPGIWFFL